MSGFEVAGVILGSIPLLISTIENYKNGLRTIQRWRRHDRELQSLVRNLKTERVKLQNICEKLLDGLIPPSQIDAMVENLGGQLWSSQKIQDKIRLRLWRSWDVFEETLRDIQVAIVEMEARLDTGSDIAWSDKLLPVKELRRASFALSWSTYAELLNTIQSGISNLEALANLNIELEPQRRVRSRIRILGILRDLSSSVFRAVSASLACSCAHRMSMRLSNCATDITPIDDEWEIIQSLKIHLALSSGQRQAQDVNQWDELVVQASPSSPLQSSDLMPAILEPTMRLEKERKKGVRFSLARLSSSTTLTQTETLVVTSLMSGATVPALQSRMNLCSVLASLPGPATSCLGVITDQLHNNPRSYTVSPLCDVPRKDKLSMISLHEVLGAQTCQHPPTYRQRLQLAVLVATSVLQYYDTPWLPKALTSRSIFFIKVGDSPHFEKPFIVAAPNNAESEAKSFPVRNPTLLALGVLLVELLRGCTIDMLRAPEEVLGAEMHLLSNYMTAQRLLSDVSRVSSNYGSAVRRCIDGEFPRQHLDLNDEDFRHEVYSGVVALLEEDFRNASSAGDAQVTQVSRASTSARPKPAFA